MAEIDATDSRIGIGRHKFEGRQGVNSCGKCGTLPIHDLHRGFDFDSEVAPPLPLETKAAHTPSPFFCGTSCNTPIHTPETIAEEAARIVYGDREQAYDDPNQNFRRVAKMWTGTLDKKLAPGCEITPRDVALMFIQLKISRESFKPQRDNRVDIVGYALCLDRIVQAEDADAAE